MIPNAVSIRIGQNVTVVSSKQQPTRTYKLDFTSGRIRGITDGPEAMKQAIVKIIDTERFNHLIYSWNYGAEMNRVVGESFQVLASEIKRIVREALLADSRIEDVTDFVITRIDKRTVSVAFVAATVWGNIPVDRRLNISV